MFILENGIVKMLTKNNWYTSNILDRFHNKTSSFDAYLNPYTFSEMSFDDSCEFTINLLKQEYRNFYIALSGGLDSLFITRQFVKHGVNIQPIIVECSNYSEIERAFLLCEELNLKPTVIRKSESELFDYYYQYIHKPFGGVGYITSYIMVVAEHTIKNNGTLISGNHLMGDGDEMSNEIEYANANEWDFYTDGILKECNNIDFLLYTPEIVYASMPKNNVVWGDYKEKLYGIKNKSKIRPDFSQELIDNFMQHNKSIPYRVSKKNWTRQEFFDTFNKVKK